MTYQEPRNRFIRTSQAHDHSPHSYLNPYTLQRYLSSSMNYYSTDLSEFFNLLARPVSPTMPSPAPSTPLPPSSNPSPSSSAPSTPLSQFSLLGDYAPSLPTARPLSPSLAIAALTLAQLATPPLGPPGALFAPALG